MTYILPSCFPEMVFRLPSCVTPEPMIPVGLGNQRPTRARCRGPVWTTCCLLVMLSWGLIRSAAAAAPAGGASKPPVVTVMAVIEAEVNSPETYVGRVEAIQAVDLRARVEGFLEQVKFKEGGEVRAGDLLYVIEEAPYKAKLDAAKAGLANAEATLTKARQYLQRLQNVRSGGVSATDLESALSAELQAKAQVQAAAAGLEQAEIDLGYTRIKAPISGRIGKTAYTRGNLVGSGSGPLARIVQIDPIRVVYSISDLNLSGARISADVGKAAAMDCRLVPRIQLPGGELLPSPGRLDFMDNQMDVSTGSLAVRAVFDNAGEGLLPGQYVTVQVSCRQGKRLPVVPQAAVQEDREGRYVFVLDGQNKAQQRRINTGITLGADWVVESGLVAGETIIVQGVQKVIPGQAVEPVTDRDATRG
jgi:RND family efflux transporter MFP subunit